MLTADGPSMLSISFSLMLNNLQHNIRYLVAFGVMVFAALIHSFLLVKLVRRTDM